VRPFKPTDAPGTASRFTVLGALIVAIACLYWARIVFMPIAAAMLATFLLSPVVALLRRTGLHRVAAVVIVLLLTILLVTGLGWGLFSQLTTLTDDLPKYRATLTRKIMDVQRLGRGGTLQKVEETAHDVMAQIERAHPPDTRPLPVVVTGPSPIWQLPKLVEPIGATVFVLVLMVFMLIQQRELRARIVRLFGSHRLAETTRALDEASERISRYLLTQTALNTSFGVTIAVGLFAYALLVAPFHHFSGLAGSGALAVLMLRGMLYPLSGNPYWLLSVQLLDGVGAGIFGALFPLVVADLTRGTGHFNISQGAIATAAGLGGALSTTAAGLIVVKAGYSAAFLFLAAVAGAGLIGFATMMPETLRRAQDEGRPSG